MGLFGALMPLLHALRISNAHSTGKENTRRGKKKNTRSAMGSDQDMKLIDGAA